MAFSDVIDKSNADQCLLAVIEPKTITGIAASKLYMSERCISCHTFVPGDSGAYYFAGVVNSWGEFGYVGNDIPELVVSDGSVLLRNDRPFGSYGSFSKLLCDYELQGASIWIGQMLVEIVAGSVNYRTALIFSGVVSEVGDITRGTVELQFTDGTTKTPIIPFTEITRAEFSDAPEESIGTPIPIIMGDFSEMASTYTGITSADLQEAGLGNLAGVPAILTDKKLDTWDEGPRYRISDHLIKDLDSDAGVMLLEPEEEIPGRVHPDDWALVNTSYAGIETDWPMRVKIPITADGRGSVWTTGLNHMLACDGDPSTYVALGNDPGYHGWCTLVPRSVSQLGSIKEVQVCAWIFDGSGGLVRLGLGLRGGGAWYYPTGQYTETTFTGNEQICRHTLVLTNGWPADDWSFDNYELLFQSVPSAAVAKIREMWLLVTYIPNRIPAPPKKVLGRARRGAHYVDPRREEEYRWPTHNPMMLTYPKGIKDDGSGTYTGSANALIENGADIAHYLAANYLGLSSSQVESGFSNTDIGSPYYARIELGTYHKLAMFLGDKEEAASQYELLCQECRAMPVWNATGKLGMVVIDPTPQVNYRASHAAFDFVPDEHFYAHTFRCWRTPLDQLATSVFIEFDYCHATGKFRKTTFITPDGTDNGFGTDDDSARKTLAGYAETRFGPGREFRLQAYDVRNQGVAKALRNFYFDNLWRPRVWYEFQCGVHVCDLSVGHVTRFGVELINGMKVPTPDTTNEHWDDFLWYTAGVTRLEQEGDVSRYLVRGFEAIVPTTSSDWVAAADDT